MDRNNSSGEWEKELSRSQGLSTPTDRVEPLRSSWTFSWSGGGARSTGFIFLGLMIQVKLKTWICLDTNLPGCVFLFTFMGKGGKVYK